MKVKLISHSKTPGNMSLTDQISYCARVSSPKNQNNFDSAEGLLKYLLKEGHWSPFEMVTVLLEIETTRDIGRQILRHRSFSFQEFSQRYAETNQENFVFREARLQDLKNRQNSIENLDLDLEADWVYMQKQLIEAASHAYQWALDNGIAKEQARAVLPEGNTMTKMYMSGTMRSWIHYLQQRLGKGTQKEHREIALECQKVIARVFPLIKILT